MVAWGQHILKVHNIQVTTVGKPMAGPGLFVGNHLGLLDIAVLLSQAPFMFLAKDEISRWPLIGNVLRYMNMPTVKRHQGTSRRQAAATVARMISDQREKVCVFPAGTTTLGESKPWRFGAFDMAAETGVTCQTFVLNFEPRRPCAYIDRDNFLMQLWRLSREPAIELVITWSEPYAVTKDNLQATCQEQQDWCRQQLGVAEELNGS